MSKLFLGIGINDADYVVQRTVEGKRLWCTFYKTWSNMMIRGYSEKEKARNPTYADVSVCKEWLVFSKFKQWMLNQEWEGKDLDKDLLVSGNKIYCPDACMFVSSQINCLFSDRRAMRGELPIGVHWCKRDKRFISQCNKDGKRKRLGGFSSSNDAHRCWQNFKLNLIHEACENEKDIMVKECLYRIANKIHYDFSHNLETKYY
jgi:hypothetical protein